MAKKISQLTQATEVKSDDVTVIVQDGETKKLPLNLMVTKQDIENKKVAGLAKLDEIEATYENDTYTPTITVKNKSSVKVGEGDGVDYSANVMDGHAKSAILSGNTLVNLAIEKDTEFTEANQWKHLRLNQSLLNSSKKYLVSFDSSQDYKGYVHLRDVTTNTYITGATLTLFKQGNNKILITDFSQTELNTFADIRLTFYLNNGSVVIPTISNIILLEYVEGMENWDIPYFTGMQSVKLPVLMTTGKNLLDINKLADINNHTATLTTSTYTKAYPLQLKPNTTYSISRETSDKLSVNLSVITIIDGSENRVNITGIANKSRIATTGDGGVLYLAVQNVNESNLATVINDVGYLQVEEGSVITPYEPYKTNILTVNEDVTLRGVGNGGHRVEDVLDLKTGELISSIGEVLLDGTQKKLVSQNWGSYAKTRFELIGAKEATIGYEDAPLLSDKLKPYGYWGEVDKGEYFFTTNNAIDIVHSRDKDIVQWLNDNPTLIVYPLLESTVKTVDLMPSGTHPSTTPYCWKNGHIQLSSSGLLPNLEYSVVTSRAGQINQNATMIVKNDKRIFDLEILLAGGLVNTTYQALTLQNQVETGLSKVSLNSETEPDYLLYHMIMKLIEEKAYKLDDLTEKVSVFYLYEKLSDEQFETIYSALYPFVEDEIVEEPVVEELPEVVEDEVIM